MTEWWHPSDTYAASMWLWMLFLLWGGAKVLAWTVFKKKPKTFYHRPRQRAPLMRAFFGDKAKRADETQQDWDKV